MLRQWLLSTATSLFHNTIVMLLDSNPLLFINLVVLRPHIIALSTAYCTMSISKLILVISPATFQNLSASKAFWMSTVAVLALPLVDIIPVEIKCGYNNKEVHDQYEYRVILQFELGIKNKTFESTIENITESAQDVFGGYNGKDNVCFVAPIIKIISILTTVLELIKLIIVVMIELRKLVKQKRIEDIPIHTIYTKPNSLVNPQLNISQHHIPPVRTSSLPNPEVTSRNFDTQSNGLVNVLPAEEGDNFTDSEQETATATVVTIAVIEATPAATIDNTDVKNDATTTVIADTNTENSAEFVARTARIEVNPSLLDSTTARVEDNGDLIEKNVEQILGSAAVIKVTSASSQNTSKTAEIANEFERTLPSIVEIEVFNEEISASKYDTVTSIQQMSTTKVFTADQTIKTNNISATPEMVPLNSLQKTVAGTIKNTLKFILFRAVTLVLALFFLYIVALISVYITGQGKQFFFPWFGLLLARLLAIFSPVGYIIFDRDLRIYVFFKVKKMWQRFSYFLGQ